MTTQLIRGTVSYSQARQVIDKVEKEAGRLTIEDNDARDNLSDWGRVQLDPCPRNFFFGAPWTAEATFNTETWQVEDMVSKVGDTEVFEVHQTEAERRYTYTNNGLTQNVVMDRASGALFMD